MTSDPMQSESCVWPCITVNRLQSLILVIDDDAEVREATTRILEKGGFTVISGATAAEAVSLTRQHRPDLLVLDVMLPDGSGVDAAKTVKQEPGLSDVFVVLASGTRISPEEQAEGLSKGLADGYIARPFSQVEFLARIDAFLRIRATQKALRDSEERYRTVAFFTYDWEYWISPEGRFIYCSPSCERITGYRAEEFMQQPDLFKRIIHPDDVLEFYRHMEIIDSSGPESNEQEARIITRSGEVSWIAHVCCMVRGSDGAFRGRRASNRDITSRKEIEAKISDLNRTLEERVVQEVQKNLEQERMLIHQNRMAAMGEMIGNIAHQWRQPLNALNLLLFNFKDAYQFQEMNEAWLDKAIADGTRLIHKMSSTISDFQHFFHPEKEIKTFSALEQVREAIALVESSFQHNRISIHTDAPHDLMLSGFPNEYSQVLLNLLSNAKDAILNCRPPISGRVDMVITEQDGLGCISVRDNGGGVQEDILDRIFDPYFSTKGKGSGIGLYMSKMIIERNMNGRITAENREDGAEFKICVPIVSDDGSTTI